MTFGAVASHQIVGRCACCETSVVPVLERRLHLIPDANPFVCVFEVFLLFFVGAQLTKMATLMRASGINLRPCAAKRTTRLVVRAEQSKVWIAGWYRLAATYAVAQAQCQRRPLSG